MTKTDLDRELLFFTPTVLFAYNGGVRLSIEIDAFNGHIYWIVEAGDHITEFSDYESARDFFLENGGGTKLDWEDCNE